jgi:hypothetical protein
MAMVLTPQKPIQRTRVGERPEGLPGSTVERGRRGETRQELGSPVRFRLRAGRVTRQTDLEPRQGKPGHGRRPAPTRHEEPAAGKQSRAKTRRAEDSTGGRSAHRTRRRERCSPGEGVDSQTAPAQETVSGREGAETPRPTSRQGIAERVQSAQPYRLRTLYGRLKEELRTASGREIKKAAAAGVDQISAQGYEQHLDGNSQDLGERLKQKRSRAQHVQRHSLPKGNGKLRPLGIPAGEDQRLQGAATRLLAAIDEQDFRSWSSGERAGGGLRGGRRPDGQAPVWPLQVWRGSGPQGLL